MLKNILMGQSIPEGVRLEAAAKNKVQIYFPPERFRAFPSRASELAIELGRHYGFFVKIDISQADLGFLKVEFPMYHQHESRFCREIIDFTIDYLRECQSTTAV